MAFRGDRQASENNTFLKAMSEGLVLLRCHPRGFLSRTLMVWSIFEKKNSNGEDLQPRWTRPAASKDTGCWRHTTVMSRCQYMLTWEGSRKNFEEPTVTKKGKMVATKDSRMIWMEKEGNRVAAVYGINSVTGVEANTDYSVLHTGNTEFFIFFIFFSNKKQIQ